MDSADVIFRYFPELSARQREQFELMGGLYSEWNEKINVISRRDIDNLYTRHVLHSLAVAKFLGEVQHDTRFMDLGTGGGFPAIPLAVMYPQARFHLIDRIAKKLRVAEDVARVLGLENVTLQHGDSGECHDRFDYVVSRAVMPLDKLVKIAARNVSRTHRVGNVYDNGIVCLKGGDLEAETAAVQFPVMEYQLTEIFNDDFFVTKKLVYVPVL
ncbi:MAG: 16S rRNA (guanine(527)-N(7))-methyltransferase RsmG [Odoribacter sp.]|nr:16S rRNA (guanine(527)-N(7))-methyltransferase RsmG [Odoribacter sp.]